MAVNHWGGGGNEGVDCRVRGRENERESQLIYKKEDSLKQEDWRGLTVNDQSKVVYKIVVVVILLPHNRVVDEATCN